MQYNSLKVQEVEIEKLIVRGDALHKRGNDFGALKHYREANRLLGQAASHELNVRYTEKISRRVFKLSDSIVP